MPGTRANACGHAVLMLPQTPNNAFIVVLQHVYQSRLCKASSYLILKWIMHVTVMTQVLK